MNNLKKTWSDLTTSAGALISVLIFGLSFGASLLVLVMANWLSMHAPELTMPAVFFLATCLIALPFFAANAFECLVSKILSFKFSKLRVFLIPAKALPELIYQYLSITLPTPSTPPRRNA